MFQNISFSTPITVNQMSVKQNNGQEKFQGEYQKVQSNILHTASWLNLQSTKLLKPFNISPQQYHILRILRDRHPKPATVKLLTEHMVDKMSNASRLVEKLRQKNLVERKASDEDRRRVDVHITTQGLDLIDKATAALEREMQERLSCLSRQEAAELNRLLDTLRR